MKKLFTLAFIATGLMTLQANAQNGKEARKSPAATVSHKMEHGGATVTINYSQPSLNNRIIGKDVEPMEGKIWRTGANEATVFETDKLINVMGVNVPAGKYSLFTIYNGPIATVILNKKWEQWGAFDYDATQDLGRFDTKVVPANPVAQKLTFKISPEGIVSIIWGEKKLDFYIYESK